MTWSRLERCRKRMQIETVLMFPSAWEKREFYPCTWTRTQRAAENFNHFSTVITVFGPSHMVLAAGVFLDTVLTIPYNHWKITTTSYYRKQFTNYELLTIGRNFCRIAPIRLTKQDNTRRLSKTNYTTRVRLKPWLEHPKVGIFFVFGRNR